MPFGLKVIHKGLILVSVPLLLELLLIGSLSVLLFQSDQEKLKELKYRRGAILSARLLGLNAEVPLLLAAAMEFRSEKLFKNYEKNRVLIDRYTKEVEEVRRQCPEIKVDFKDPLLKSQEKILAMTDKYAAVMRKGDPIDIVNGLLGMSKETNEVVSTASGSFYDMESHGTEQTALSRQRQEKIRREQSWILLTGIVANFLAVGVGLSIYYRREFLLRVKTIAQNTLALAKGEPMLPELGGSDEIALVDHAFHTMKKQLSAASARARDLFNNASDVICVIDADGNFVRINPICKQYWGYDPEELLGSGIRQLCPADHKDQLKDFIAAAKKDSDATSFEYGTKTKGGQEKSMLWSVYWSEPESSLYCIIHDISEQKAAEQEKAQFLELMSSNLRKPLHSIADGLKSLTDKNASGLTPQAIEKLTTTCSNTNRLVELVNDLLLMNEMQSGKIQIKKEKCRVGKLLKQSFEDVQTLADKKKITIELSETNAECELDANRLIQVLVNLLSNAIKFSPEKSTVVLSAEVQGDILNFNVIDHGRGIPQSQIGKIFEKFGQVDAADGKRMAGTGLGLPICKQIVEEHGGEISVESVEDHGSKFSFWVPIDDNAAQRLSEHRNQSHKSTSPEARSDLNSSLAPPAMASPRERLPASRLSQKRPEKLPPAGSRSRAHSKLNLAAKGMLLVGIPLLCEIIIVTCLNAVLRQTDREWASEWHDRLVSNTATALNIRYINAVVRMVHDVTDEEWQAIQKDMSEADKQKRILYKLLTNDPHSLAYLKKAEPSFETFESLYNKAGESYKSGRSVFIAVGDRHKSIPKMLSMFRNMQKIIDIAENKESESPRKQKILRQLQGIVLFLGLSANVASCVFLAVYFSRDINNRLMLLADNANRLSNDKPLNTLIGGSDELAKLDEAFHATAATLSEARKKERAVFDNSQDVICVLDRQGHFLSINPASEKLWGIPRDELLHGKVLPDITVSEDRDRTIKTLAEPPEGENRFSFESRISASRDGKQTYMMWACSKNPSEPIFYCLARDISAKKELEALKQEFLSMVSHDLRSPLTAIHGITQLTSTGTFGDVPEKEKSLLSKINNDCRDLVELISDLLDLEKLNAGKMRMTMEEVEMADVINKSISACMNKERVKLAYTPELDETVLRADIDRLAQALASVINYAARHSTNGVRVRLCNSAGWSEVQVLDSGPVLGDAELKQCFQKQNLKAQNTAVGSDIGGRLSLELAGKIVEFHGGKAFAAPSDSGNIYKICLPNDQSFET